MKRSKWRYGAGSLAMALLVSACNSQTSDDPGADISQTDGYQLDILSMDSSETYAFNPSPNLGVSERGTIEFWVRAGWEEAPEEDPILLSNAGPEGASYLVSILRDRDGLALTSGDQTDVAPFDFSDGKLHHVAFVNYGDFVQVRVDQRAVAELDIEMQNLPSDGLYIGSARGESMIGFIGELAELRIWDVAVTPEALQEFSRANIFEEGNTHPDLQFLAVISDFQNGTVIYPEP